MQDPVLPVHSNSQLQANLRWISNNLQEDRSQLLLENSERRIFDTEKNLSQHLIFTTYFTTKKDPQRAQRAPKNDIKFIAPWYESINAIRVPGIVFHDGLSADFIEEYSTQYVKFLRCHLGAYSLNDERFFIYYQYILEHCPKLEYVLFTDGSDVLIKRNPFDLFKQYSPNTIFVGRDDGNLIRQCKFKKNLIRVFQQDRKHRVEANFFNLPMYSAGILGGSLIAVVYFLRQFLQLLEECNSDRNHNMAAFNYTLFKYWYPKIMRGIQPYLGKFWNFSVYLLIHKILIHKKLRQKLRLLFLESITHQNTNDYAANTENIVTSFPLCSAFKEFQNDSDAYIIHK